MSERRRSTRLVGTPKVNYEERPVDLLSRPSSLKKRRDSPDGKYSDGENKRFKKAKLKHDDDDEDTILDDGGFKPASERRSNKSTSNKSIPSKSTTSKTKKKRPNSKATRDETDEDATDLDDEAGDSGQLYFLNESTEELKENHLNSQNTANDHPASRQGASSDSSVPGYSTSREKAAVQRDPSNSLVDEHGFIILDDETDPPSSPPDHQQSNVLDVTDYGQFDDDESTLVDQDDQQVDHQIDHQEDRTASNDENRAAATDKSKRQPRKKFVKKHKPSRASIELGNFVKHTNETLDSQATIIINRAPDQPDDAPDNSSRKEQSNQQSEKQPNQSSQTKKKMKNFVDFFESQKITKASPVEQQDDEVQVIQPVKRGRGRPRKNPPTPATTPQSTAGPTKKLPEVLIEPDNDCELVDTVPSIGKRDALLDNTNSNNARLSPPIDDNTIIVLDKRDAFSATRPDDPWTIKYRPVRADQVLDNQLASEKIKNWIHDFSKNVESRVLYDSDDEDEERFETCVLVTGPTGCGKTAMVYAIAEELNYKVFEINCSSRRNSRFINQIKEATLSHTVTRQSDSSSNQLFSGNSKGASKASSKNPQPPPPDSKQKTLFSFFQKKPAAATAVQAPLIDESSFSQETVNNLKALSINSNSLILFDDVDVIFEEDGGFWQALSSLIEHTKRPIILTATGQIDNIRQEIRTGLRVPMNYPGRSALTDRLKSIVMNECYEPDDGEVSLSAEHVRQIELISKENHRDIRGCLNRLQFDFSSVSVSNQAAIGDSSGNELTTEKPFTSEPMTEKLSSEPTTEKPSTGPSDRTSEPGDEQNEPIRLQTYQSVILSDLLSSSHFQTNSRNEFDSSCKYEETYQSQDLRECIRDECIRLSSLPANDGDQFGRVAGGSSEKADEESHSNWLDSFERCVAAVEDILVPVSVRSPLYCDYLPYLSSIMSSEQQRFKLFVEHTRRARRFLHYLDQNGFHLSDFVKQFLKDHYLAVEQI